MAGNFGFEPYSGTERFVFISYKIEEEQTAAEYASYLHENGVNVYYDAALAPSQNWAKTLLETIERENCAGVVLFASERAVKSQPVIDEVRKAHYTPGKIVFAVYIENIVTLEEPMKTFLSATHSVFAWQMEREQAKREVLSGARRMIAGDKTPPRQADDMDKLWNTAQLYINNSQRSKSASDVEKALAPLRRMIEQNPADYRGWLGLALCDVALPARDIDHAVTSLKAASGHYSYVISAGGDGSASPMYMQFKSNFWRGVIEIMEKGLETAADTDAAQRFAEKCEALEDCLGHTEPGIRSEYENTVSSIYDYIGDTVDQFEWRETSDRTVELVRFCGDTACCEIPPSVDGRIVTSVASGAFAGCADVRTVVIPAGVRRIAPDAFAECPNITIRGKGGMFSRARKYAKKYKLPFEKITRKK